MLMGSQRPAHADMPAIAGSPAGSARTSATLEPSYAKALGVGDEFRAHVDPLRPGRFNTQGGGRLRRQRVISEVAAACASCRRSTRWPRRGSTKHVQMPASSTDRRTTSKSDTESESLSRTARR